MTEPADHAGTPVPVRLLIVGAGGHGRETLDVVEAINRTASTGPAPETIDAVGFLADLIDEDVLGRRGVPHVGSADVLRARLQDPGEPGASRLRYHLAIGSGAARARLDVGLIDGDPAGVDRAASLVHPAATMGSDLRLGPGLYLAAGARLTTNITVGRHTHLNLNAAISHDCVVGDFVTLSPGALVNGNVTLGDGVFLGTGAIVLPGRSVGRGAVIGAGAVVTRDVPPEVTATGVPARW